MLYIYGVECVGHLPDPFTIPNETPFLLPNPNSQSADFPILIAIIDSFICGLLFAIPILLTKKKKKQIGTQWENASLYLRKNLPKRRDSKFLLRYGREKAEETNPRSCPVLRMTHHLLLPLIILAVHSLCPPIQRLIIVGKGVGTHVI